MKSSVTICAIAALVVGVSVPAAVLPNQAQAEVPAQAARTTVTPQVFSAASSAVTAVSRDAFGVEIIPPEPVVVAYAASTYSGAYAGSVTGKLATWPASGGVNDGFGYRGSEFHKGIDIMASYGSAIVAASPGVVTTVGFDGGWGQYVKIDHGGGVSTLYSHMISGSPIVSAGQTVGAGEMIGSVGDTGYVTVAHLHFEVYVDGSVTDPMPWLP